MDMPHSLESGDIERLASHPFTPQSWQVVTDEEIARRKLLLDGDARGDGRRIQELIKCFFKWISLPIDQEEKREAIYGRILLLMDDCELAMNRSFQMMLVNNKELEKYESQIFKMEENIEQASKNIECLKEELRKRKIDVMYKKQYEALIHEISSYPSRNVAVDRLSHLEDDVKRLVDEKTNLESQLDHQRKKLNELLAVVDELTC